MNLESFEYLLKSENRCRLYLVRKCWGNQRRFCIRCKGHKVYRLVGKRYRCPGCGYTFGDCTGRWIGQLNITAKQWFWIIKLFELEVSTRRIAKEVEISYPTALKATHLIRYAILQQAEDFPLLRGEIELDESYFGGRRKGRRGRGAAGKVPVFGILERHGHVRVSIIEDVSAETLLNKTVTMVKRGSIIYTDKFKSYDALMFCGYRHLKVDHGKRFARGKVYINGLEGFWSFAKERLIKFHGVSKKRFPVYLKEMEFRYNHRRARLFDLLTDYVTNLVPNL